MSKPKAIIVSGYFNPLHKGHLELFEKALNSVFFSELMPDEVIVAVDGPISKKHEDILSTYSLQYSFMKIVKLFQILTIQVIQNVCIVGLTN